MTGKHRHAGAAGRRQRPDKALAFASRSDAIAVRAYELFLARGGAHGHDREDWFQAEREITTRAPAREADAQSDIDRELAQSFPASDPPSWTPGTATPAVPASPATAPGKSAPRASALTKTTEKPRLRKAKVKE
jgi:hypothetical protein